MEYCRHKQHDFGPELGSIKTVPVMGMYASCVVYYCSYFLCCQDKFWCWCSCSIVIAVVDLKVAARDAVAVAEEKVGILY